MTTTPVGGAALAAAASVSPDQVHEVLARHLLTDGFKLVFDSGTSRGSWFVDARSGERYLDLYTFFGSAALGTNPAGLADDADFLTLLGEVAANKPATAGTRRGSRAAR